MSDANKPRANFAIVCGIYCLVVGLAQFLYSFLAFVSLILVEVLGIVLTLGSVAVAAVPNKPYEIPYPRALANSIAVTGMVLCVAAFVAGGRCLYRRHVSRIDFAVCAVICAFLAALHLTNSLMSGGKFYMIATLLFSGMLLVDRRMVLQDMTPTRTPMLTPKQKQRQRHSAKPANENERPGSDHQPPSPVDG